MTTPYRLEYQYPPGSLWRLLATIDAADLAAARSCAADLLAAYAPTRWTVPDGHTVRVVGEAATMPRRG